MPTMNPRAALVRRLVAAVSGASGPGSLRAGGNLIDQLSAVAQVIDEGVTRGFLNAADGTPASDPPTLEDFTGDIAFLDTNKLNAAVADLQGVIDLAKTKLRNIYTLRSW